MWFVFLEDSTLCSPSGTREKPQENGEGSWSNEFFLEILLNTYQVSNTAPDSEDGPIDKTGENPYPPQNLHSGSLRKAPQSWDTSELPPPLTCTFQCSCGLLWSLMLFLLVQIRPVRERQSQKEAERCAGHRRRAEGTPGSSSGRRAEVALNGGLRGGETWRRRLARVACLFHARTPGTLHALSNLILTGN